MKILLKLLLLTLVNNNPIVLDDAVKRAEDILARHTCRLSECPFNSDLNIPIPTMLFVANGIRATISPNYKYSYLNPRVKWDEDLLVLTLIHEALHSNRICGPDNKKRVRLKSACTIGHSVLDNADDIDSFIVKHLSLKTE